MIFAPSNIGSRVKLLPPGQGAHSFKSINYDERTEAGLPYEASGIIVADGGAQYRYIRFDGETFSRKVRAARVTADFAEIR